MFTTPAGTRPSGIPLATNQTRTITTRLLARVGTLGTQQMPHFEMTNLRNVDAETPPRPATVNRTQPSVSTTSFINRGFINDGDAPVYQHPRFEHVDAPRPAGGPAWRTRRINSLGPVSRYIYRDFKQARRHIIPTVRYGRLDETISYQYVE